MIIKLKSKTTLMKKLMIWFLILITVPLSIIGVMTYKKSQKSLRLQAESTLNSMLGGGAKELTLKMKHTEDILDLLSSSELILALANEFDNNNDTAQEISLVQAKLLNFKRSLGEMCENLSISDKNGNVLISTYTMDKGINISSRDYFQQSIAGQNYWSDVLLSKFSEKPIVCYSIPLKASSGRIVGVLFISQKFESITQILENLKVGKTGYAYMIDKNGLVLYHPQKEKILKENFIQTTSDNKEFNQFLISMSRGEKGSCQYKYSGITKFATCQPIAKWSIALTLPVDEYMTFAYEMRNNTVVIVFIAMVISIFIAANVSRGITKSIKYIMDVMLRAGEGDLTVISNVTSHDEVQILSESFNQMISAQKNVLSNVIEVASKVSVSSEECSSISEEMASSSQSQTASVNELKIAMHQMSKSIEEVANKISDIALKVSDTTTSVEQMDKESKGVLSLVNNTNSTIADMTSSLEEMNASIEMVANNSNIANNEAKKTVQIAQDGKISVKNTINEMEKINTTMEHLTEVIKALGTTAIQIGDIVVVIDDIADQTNLLALNASIEAARAGEHGKGFAVVANAIGNLAEKSGKATKDIANLIKHIQLEVTNAITTTDEGANKVKSGVNLVQNIGTALDTIFEAIDHTTKLINEIATSTTEQSKASTSILDSVSKINEVSIDLSSVIQNQVEKIKEIMHEMEKINLLTQGVASAAEEQSASSEEIFATTENLGEMSDQVSSGGQEVASASQLLSQEADGLVQLVSKFKI